MFSITWGNTPAWGWWQYMVRSHLYNPKQQPNSTKFVKDSMSTLMSGVKVPFTLSVPPTQPCYWEDGNLPADLQFFSGFVLPQHAHVLVCLSTLWLPVLVKTGITVSSLSKSSVSCPSSLSGPPVRTMRRKKQLYITIHHLKTDTKRVSGGISFYWQQLRQDTYFLLNSWIAMTFFLSLIGNIKRILSSVQP